MDQRHSESPARTRRSNAKLPSQLRPPSYRRVQDLKRAAGHLEHVSMQLGRACALVLAPFKIGSAKQSTAFEAQSVSSVSSHTATDPDGALRPPGGRADRALRAAARLRRCVHMRVHFNMASGRCGSALLVIRAGSMSPTSRIAIACAGRRAWDARPRCVSLAPMGWGFRKPRATAAGGATTRALRPCAMALPLLPSDCARLRRTRVLFYRPSGCWLGSWRAGFPSSCDSQGITDQDSCTAFCDPDDGGKKKGMWLGDPGPGACTCTGCLFCQTCANPKPQDDGAPPVARVCVCSASTETTSLAPPEEGAVWPSSRWRHAAR